MKGCNYQELVLTGGPGAGKSVSLELLAKSLEESGVQTLICSELATDLMSAGVPNLAELARDDPGRFYDVEREMLLCQRQLRDRYRGLARALGPEPVVIIYDRAEFDARAYLGAERFERIARELGITIEDRDCYDAVLHLRTAAFAGNYTQSNNPARVESAAEARAADERILESWLGQPHLWVIGAMGDFASKQKRLIETANHALGIPEAREIERRYLIAGPPDLTAYPLSRAAAVEIEQTYLLDSPALRVPAGSEARVRMRRQGRLGASFTQTRKRRLADHTREEHEQGIDRARYEELLEHADPDRDPVRKRRFCFVHRDVHFELDAISRPGDELLWILEVEQLRLSEAPPLDGIGLEIIREITDDPAFSNSSLARRSSPALPV